MARSPCSTISQASLPSAPLVPGSLAIQPRRRLALSNPAAARRLVARCAAGDKAEAEKPIEKSRRISFRYFLVIFNLYLWVRYCWLPDWDMFVSS
jgi:3-hydroxyacyl-[acyl-carrier-protein] dehydratase